MHISWDDIQTVEALVRSGNVVTAAKSLALRHSSVSRRIAAIETSLGTPLFVRGRRLVPTALARQIAEQATDMQTAAQRVEALLHAERRARESRIVITTTDALASLVLRAVRDCVEKNHVQLVVSDRELDLEPGVTDLALRASNQPRGSLRGVKVGKLRVGVYRAATLPKDAKEWVLPSAEMRARTSMRWLRAIPRDAGGPVECDSILAMRDACLIGLGRAVIPVCLVIDDPRLIHEEDVAGSTPVWLLTSATRSGDKRLKGVSEMIAGRLKGVEGIWE